MSLPNSSARSKQNLDMRQPVVRVGFDPWNTADHVGAQRHRIAHQPIGARRARETILCERDDLQVDDAAEFLANGEQRLHAFKPRLGVDVGKRADVQIAVQRRQRDRALGVFGDPGGVVFLLDLARQIDGGKRVGHPVCVVVGERILRHHLQGPNLAQMQMRVDEGFGHQVAARVDLLPSGQGERRSDGGDPPVRDRHVDKSIGRPAQARIADTDIDLGHRLSARRRLMRQTGILADCLSPSPLNVWAKPEKI